MTINMRIRDGDECLKEGESRKRERQSSSGPKRQVPPLHRRAVFRDMMISGVTERASECNKRERGVAGDGVCAAQFVEIGYIVGLCFPYIGEDSVVNVAECVWCLSVFGEIRAGWRSLWLVSECNGWPRAWSLWIDGHYHRPTVYKGNNGISMISF